MGGGFEGTVISRRGAEALSFLAMALRQDSVPRIAGSTRSLQYSQCA